MSDWNEAAREIRRRAGAEPPGLAVVLGSGLGGLTEALSDPVSIPYAELPGFPDAGVSGHAGRLLVGYLGPARVVLCAGRVHYYEKGDPRAMEVPVRTMAALDAGALLLSNAAGSTSDDMAPGSLMAISDHINWSGRSPLIGLGDDSAFIDLSEAYDPNLRQALHKIAERQGVFLHDGIYAWFSGPNFETPAEINAVRVLGADAVGMSTVPECIIARHAGMRVAAVSVITNFAAGMRPGALSHAETKQQSGKVAVRFERLVTGFAAEVGAC